MRFKMVESLREAMKVRKLRNSCRAHLTNSTNYITLLGQFRWYFKDYVAARRMASYRLYLLYDDRNSPVGYGALALRNGKLVITECVGPKFRGLGYGLLILDRLIGIAVEERRDLVAEIWAINVPSLALHQKAGFELESQIKKGGKELQRYQLSSHVSVRKKQQIIEME
jgi:RimJ/RimL family protein N-acetyltransferase